MEAKILTDEHREAWNDFVASSSNSSVLQSWEWGQVKSGLWQPIRIALFNGSQIVAGISILKRPLPLGRSLFYAPRGPIVDINNEKLFDALLLAVCLEAQKHKAVALKIDPEITESPEVERKLNKLGFIKKKK